MKHLQGRVILHTTKLCRAATMGNVLFNRTYLHISKHLCLGKNTMILHSLSVSASGFYFVHVKLTFISYVLKYSRNIAD